jgi:RsiW-degrading membrane proteinase PrsW (M82 family)
VGQGISTAFVADLFLFLALVIGLVTVSLVPLVYRVRAIPPPKSVTIAAFVAGALPPITILLRWLL